ncbi:MAG: acyltransferase [Pseudomonadota bacterium]
MRVAHLDGLRGLAAAAVMLFHFTSQLPDGILKSAFSYGWLGVEVFFVLSGIVMPLACRNDLVRYSGVSRFLARRVVRLYPPFFAAVLLTVALNYLSALMPAYQGAPYVLDIWQLLANLTYLADFTTTGWLSPVFWTLALEVQWYLLLVLLGPWFFRHLVLLVSLCVLVSITAVGVESGNIFGYLSLFTLGWLIGLHLIGHLPFQRMLPLTILLLILIRLNHGMPVLLAVVATLALIYGLPALLARLSWLGLPSYSIYLVHVPIGGRVINLLKRLDVSQPFLQVVAVVIAVVVSWIVSRLWHRLIEMPSLRWSRGYR